MENIIEQLKKNHNNTIEYYSDGIREKKLFSDVFIDVLKVKNKLYEMGITKGDKIGIVTRNSYEFILLDLASISIGSTFIPFHFNDYNQKYEDIISEFDLKFLIVEDNSNASQENNRIIKNSVIKESYKIIDKKIDTDDIEVGWNESDYFTIISTSGSTGTHKYLNVKFGVPFHFIRTCISKFELRPDDKALLFLPFSQFSSRCYIYSAIILGFNLALSTPDKVIFDLKRYSPTVMQGVPYFFEGIYSSFASNILSSDEKKEKYNLFLKEKDHLSQNDLIEVQKQLFSDIHSFFGGKMRIMITGAAPIKREVLEFFHNVGLPIYEAYGLVESGLISLNYPNCYKIGSVGRILPDMNVRIDNNEVIVKSDYLWGDHYINCSEEINREIFIDDNTIATGDIGYLDEDNFLYLCGRKKDVIVLSSGLKVHPVNIEKALELSPKIKQAAVFGSGMPFITAVIVCDENEKTEIKYEIKRINKNLNDQSKIKGYITSKEEFSTENGFITSNLKLDRKKIQEYYKQELEELYY